MLVFSEFEVTSVVLALGGGFPCETPEPLCGLGNVSRASTDIVVSRKWVKTSTLRELSLTAPPLATRGSPLTTVRGESDRTPFFWAGISVF